MNMKDAILVVAAIAFSTSVAQAQPPQGGLPGGHPILGALDVDKNQELSAEEINNATNALKALDKNADGILNEKDLGRMGSPRAGGQGGAPGRGASQRGSGGADAGKQVNNFADRLMAFDKNKNGKIEKDELPERMQAVMSNLDSNKDNVLDKQELDELRKAAAAGGAGGRPNRQQPNGRGGGTRRGGGLPGGGLAPGGVDQMIERAFKFDKDSDGKLSREELTEFAKSMQLPQVGPPGMGGPGIERVPGGGADR